MHALSHENSKINLKEPFKGLFTQGMVCHETYKDQNNNWVSPDEIVNINGEKFLKKDSSQKIKVGPIESMSKSKKNTIDPEEIIKNYGADSVRLFILSDSPPEKDVQWSDEGMKSSYKFIQKLWVLNQKILDEAEKNYPQNNKNQVEIIASKFVDDVEKNIENFSYNKIIANFHEVHSKLNKILSDKLNKEELIKNYSNILVAMSTVIPHFANECLEMLWSEKKEEKNKWPSINKKILVSDKINFVVQINGKTRTVLKIKTGLNQKELLNIIHENDKIKNYVKDKTIKNTIFIADKLINIIT